MSQITQKGSTPGSASLPVPSELQPGGLGTTKPRPDNPPPPLWKNRVRVYIKQTGGDPGSTCEIRGSFTANSGFNKVIKIDIPVESDFGGENEGYGRLIAEMNGNSQNLPLVHTTKIYEEGILGVGNRSLAAFTVNWTTDWYPGWKNGNEYWVTSECAADPRYKAIVRYQVTYLGEVYDQ